MAHTEIVQPLKVVEKKPLDAKFICKDMTEANALAYPGFICYIEGTGKFYRYLSNGKAHEWQVFDIADYATRSELKEEIAALINGSPDVLDTLAEIAAALNNDKDFGQTMVNELVKKVDKVAGYGLSERNFTQLEKTKLQGLENYTHPETHPATMITQDANNRFVSDAEKTTWNNKADKTNATTTADGLMSKADKTKLEGIATGANNYTHPATHPATMIMQDANNRFVSDEEKSAWNNKANKTNASTTADGLMSKADKAKLDTMSEGSGATYTHPATHPATMITQDANNRFVSDAEKSAWSNKADKTNASTTADGLMSKADKAKLDTISEGSGAAYTHPEAHPATMITQDANNRFVSDAEKTNWNAKAGTAISTTTVDGLMSKADKTKLEGIATGANNYTHPVTHPATMITQDSGNRFVSDAEKTTWSNKADKTNASTTADGLMSKADKTKLEGVATGANNYTHPATHPANMITQDANNRFVSDAEKTAWNDKYTRNEVENKLSALVTSLDWKEAVSSFAQLATTYPNPDQGWTVNVKDVNKTYTFNGSAWIQTGGAIPLSTTTLDGLMSSADKTKLEGIATGANNYTHPATHPASMITQDADNRFVSDAEKASFARKNGNETFAGEVTASKFNGSLYKNFGDKGGVIVSGSMADNDVFRIYAGANGNNQGYLEIATADDATEPIYVRQYIGLDYGQLIRTLTLLGGDGNSSFPGVVSAYNFVANGKTVASTDVASTSVNGLMSAADKTKLDRINGGKVTVSSNQPTGAQLGDIWIKI